MPTTLTNGIQLPDKGSVDWYSSMQSNYNLIDTHLGDTDVHVTAEDKANWNSKQGSLSQAQLDAIAQVATNTSDIATLQSGKANVSHTHSSSDITDIGDYATKQYVDTSISGLVDSAPNALDTLNELAAALNDDANFASTVTTALATKANSADLATVATSGSYTDLSNKPTINNSTITIQKNGSTVDTFTTNGSNKTINIPVPTKTSDLTNDSNFVVSSNLATVATSGDYDDLSNKPSIPINTSDLNNDSGFVTLNDFDIPAKTSDLTNDSGFITSSDVPTGTSDLINDSNYVDTSNPAVASGITSAKVTDYDTHIADTDIHVTTADKTKWNNGVSQAYVFRYSSTALVASSTNSNTLLDNTDNLKVGDKVIDSNGVLFSVTAIDTENSTFTIGTALIDLAQDSDVVHKSGNETISGDKVFNNRLIKNIDVVLGTAPSTGKFSNIDIADNNKNSLLQILGGVYDTGNSYARFFVQNKMADDGTGLSPTGTLRTCGFNINLPATSTSEGQGSITPRGNKTTDFGLLSYQWRNVWCEKLYLNGTQLDPSAFALDNAVVHTSGNETVGGVKNFKNLIPIDGDYLGDEASNNQRTNICLRSNRDTAGKSCAYISRFRQNRSQGALQTGDLQMIGFDVLENEVRTNNVFSIQCSGWVDNVPTKIKLLSTGSDSTFGSSSRPSKINDLNPGALSMPDLSNGIDISSYITIGNTDDNYYTPSVNGWIWARMLGNGLAIQQGDFGSYGNYVADSTTGDKYVEACLLVTKNIQATIRCRGITSIVGAKFYPCLGNV